MARSFNQVTLVGHLTRDPETRASASGIESCRFGLAVNYSRKNPDGEWGEAVTFINIVVWERLVPVVQNFCHKGKQILVRGRLQVSSWEQDGQTRTRAEVHAQEILLLGRDSEQSTNRSENKTHSTMMISQITIKTMLIRKISLFKIKI